MTMTWMMFDCYANADSLYKRAILNLELRIPGRITDGQPQAINFPGLNDAVSLTCQVRLQNMEIKKFSYLRMKF